MNDFFKPESENTYLGWLRKARPDLYAQLRKPAIDVLVHVLEHVDWGSGTRCWASLTHLASGANNNGKGHHRKVVRDQLKLLCDLGILRRDQAIRTPKGQRVASYSVERPTRKPAPEAPSFSEKPALSTPKGGAFDSQKVALSTPAIEQDQDPEQDQIRNMSSLKALKRERGGEKRHLSQEREWQEGDVAEWHDAEGRVVTGQIESSSDGTQLFRSPFFRMPIPVRAIAPFLCAPTAKLTEDRR